MCVLACVCVCVCVSVMNQVLEEGTMEMEVIINHKHLDNGLNIIQLEQAVGAAIKSFNGAMGELRNLTRTNWLYVFPFWSCFSFLLLWFVSFFFIFYVMVNLIHYGEGMVFICPVIYLFSFILKSIPVVWWYIFFVFIFVYCIVFLP